ncbi:14214_t:CDS:2, partial [Racocetra fulgida]
MTSRLTGTKTPNGKGFQDPDEEYEFDLLLGVNRVSIGCSLMVRLNVLSQRREDFNAPKEYNDYLEMVEKLVWNLNNDIDLEKTKARIESFATENREIIAKNAKKT